LTTAAESESTWLLLLADVVAVAAVVPVAQARSRMRNVRVCSGTFVVVAVVVGGVVVAVVGSRRVSAALLHKMDWWASN